MMMTQAIYIVAFIISLFSIVEPSSLTLTSTVSNCLRDLATQELSNSYNYLQLSSKVGTSSAYPGFSSLFTKLSDDDSEKGHELVKFLALRKFTPDRLIAKDGIKIHANISKALDLYSGLREARHQNTAILKEITRCHQEADNGKDANVQDYLESHLLDHHIEVGKLLDDLQHRLHITNISEKNLITFMVDEELLQTYGDRRKDIFSK